MQYTHNTYSLAKDYKILILEENFDEKGNLVSKMIHNSRPKTEIVFTYDDKNRLVVDRELNLDKEITRNEFVYDEVGDIIEQRTFFSGSLYESIIMTKSDSGYVRVTTQDGEEVERYERDIDGENWESRFYVENELVAEHQFSYDSIQRKATKTINEIEYKLKIKTIESFDDVGKLLKMQEFNNETSLAFEKEYTYDGEHLIKIVFKDFVGKLGDYSYIYERDPEGNVIKYSCLSSSGILHSFHNFIYDDKQRVVEEFGIRNAQYDEIPTSEKEIEKFHLIHEYIEF